MDHLEWGKTPHSTDFVSASATAQKQTRSWGRMYSQVVAAAHETLLDSERVPSEL